MYLQTIICVVPLFHLDELLINEHMAGCEFPLRREPIKWLDTVLYYERRCLLMESCGGSRQTEQARGLRWHDPERSALVTHLKISVMIQWREHAYAVAFSGLWGIIFPLFSSCDCRERKPQNNLNLAQYLNLCNKPGVKQPCCKVIIMVVVKKHLWHPHKSEKLF